MGSFVTSTPLQKSSNRPSPNRVSPSRPNQSRISKQKSSPSPKTVRFETEKDSSGMIKLAQNTSNGLCCIDYTVMTSHNLWLTSKIEVPR